MPAYSTVQAGGVRTALMPGDSLALFNAEAVTANEASIPFNRADSRSQDDAGTTFSVKWSSAPGGTDTVLIQAANEDVDASYLTVYTSTGKQYDAYTDIGRSRFYRAKNGAGTTGGNLTVFAQR